MFRSRRPPRTLAPPELAAASLRTISSRRQLHSHLVRHRLAMRFILFEYFVAKGWARGIEHDSQVLRLIVFQDSLQNVVEQERHLGRHAARRIHSQHRRIKRSIYMRHRVHKKQSLRRFGHPREYTKRCRCLTFPATVTSLSLRPPAFAESRARNLSVRS